MCRYNPKYARNAIVYVLYGSQFFSRWKGASDIGFVDIESGNESKLKEAVATQGPCAIAIDAGE